MVFDLDTILHILGPSPAKDKSSKANPTSLLFLLIFLLGLFEYPGYLIPILKLKTKAILSQRNLAREI